MPALAVASVAFALVGGVDARVSEGAIALAVVPAPLLAPGIVGRMRGGRADLAGALGLGTVVLSLVVVGSRGAQATAALFTATEAFAISAMIANGLPTLRDRVLMPLRVLGWVGASVVLVTSTLTAPPIDVATAAAALALFVAGAGTSASVALLLGRNVAAAVGGAGLRDPVLGIALVTFTAGPDATGVALVYGVACAILGAVALLRR